MNQIIQNVATKANLPAWWVEAIAIEYTDCRDLAGEQGIWKFNFDRLSESDLENAVSKHNIVANGIVYHNVHTDVFRSRLVRRLISSVPVPVCKETDDAIAEGQISEYHFLFSGNPIDVWDPKLGISSHIQVLDEGKLWQWRVADFKKVKGRKYGKWICKHVDLEPLDQIHDRYTEISRIIVKPGQPGYSEFKSTVLEFYRWLDEIRRPILIGLKEIHKARRITHEGLLKLTDSMPPIMSQFESFHVRNGEIYTALTVAPIFFRGSRQHACRAEELVNSVHNDSDLIAKLDEIYELRATAVVLGVACLEAFMNGLGFEHYPTLWPKVEQLSVVSKWQLFLVLKGKGDVFVTDEQPIQFLIQLLRSRNSLVHFKGDYYKVRKQRRKSVTHVESHDMPRQVVRDLPSRLTELIENLCESTSIKAPSWLYPQPDWSP